MTIAEMNHSHVPHQEPASVTARWFTVATLTGAALLAFATMAYVVA